MLNYDLMAQLSWDSGIVNVCKSAVMISRSISRSGEVRRLPFALIIGTGVCKSLELAGPFSYITHVYALRVTLPRPGSFTQMGLRHTERPPELAALLFSTTATA